MIYVSSSCISRDRIADVIGEYAENGINCIELSGGTKAYPQLERDLVSLKQRFRLHYACHAYFPPPKEAFVVNLASCNDEIYARSIAHYENCIRMLERIGCPVLSVHAGFLVEIRADEVGGTIREPVIYEKGKAYDRFCSGYEHIRKLCDQSGIALYLENNVISRDNYQSFLKNNYLMMTDYDSIAYMKSQIHFQLLLDLGHLHVSCHTLGLSYEQECGRLKEWIRWLHVSENGGISDEHRALDENGAVVRALQSVKGKDINVTLETTAPMREIQKSIEIVKRV